MHGVVDVEVAPGHGVLTGRMRVLMVHTLTCIERIKPDYR